MFFWNKKNKIFPLVASSNVAQALGPFAFSVIHRTPWWYDRLYNYVGAIHKADIADTANLNKCIKDAADFLKSNPDTINIPLTSGFRLLAYFPLFSKDGSKHDLKVRFFSLFLTLLQLLADPNNSLDKNNPSDTVLSGFFKNEMFDIDVLNLLFSYGLTYQQFCFALQVHIERFVAKEYKIAALRNLSAFLNGELNDELKNSFPIMCNIDRKVLDVQEKSEYYCCYQHLRDAFYYYQNKEYENAATNYSSAASLLESFHNQENLDPNIAKDYEMRAQKSRQYFAICTDLAEKDAQSASRSFLSRNIT